MRYEFEREFMNDEDVEEELDAILESVRDDLEAEDVQPTVLSPIRFRQMQFVYAVLKYITRETNANITYELQKPFKSMGSIAVEGRLLEFDKPEWFARAAEFANSTDIYPLSSNKVRIEYTFHGLTVPMNGGEGK